jgi:2-iminobutanoate/2-iminopropanoate deaminase
MDGIVSATVVLADEDDFAGTNEGWMRWFPADPLAWQGAKLPARIPGLKVSIAVIAENDEAESPGAASKKDGRIGNPE